MQKTYVTPPERRQRRMTLRDDLRVTYVGEELDKHGVQGQKRNLTCNMFSIGVKSNTQIHMYSVVIEPEVKWRGMKDSLIQDCKFDQYHYNLNCIFFPDKKEDEFTKTITRRDNSEYKITFKYKNQLLKGSVELNNMIGSLARRCIEKMDMVPINRGLYILDSATPIGQFPYKVINGYNTTVLPHENELLMTVNMSNKVMSSDNANEYMRQLMRNSRGGNPKDVLMAEMVGRTVLTTYNNKTYRIDDIEMNLNPQSTFPKRQPDGSHKDVSYAQYFQEAYNLQIRDMNQPLFISRPKKVDRRKGAEENQTISLIPELCVVCGMEEKYKADFQFKKAMDAAIKKDPRARAAAVNKFMRSFNESPAHKDFAQWGFTLNNRPQEVPGRVLNPYKVNFGGNQQKDTSRPFDFRGTQMYDARQPITRWVVISPENAREGGEFINNLNKVCPGLGMSLGRPKQMSYRNVSDLTRCLNDIKGMNDRAHMIVLILRNQDKTTYDHFKKETCLNMGVPSQCLLLKHFRNPKGLLSVITKIAIQMQVKVGGVGWSIRFPPAKPFMIVGMDTYHDSSVRGMSCVATVASLNNDFSQYTWATSMVQARQETNTVIRQQFEHLIRRFIAVNNEPPERIIIFRDGVGEGQVSHIMDFEFSQIQQAIQEKSPQAQTCFMTINKRIEARLYDQDRNPPAGTVVDQVCTYAGQKDFYLVPLESRQGAVAPIHYKIHYNSVKLKVDNFQYIVYMLCFLYANWPGAIKVPAPCQYAHKLAYLVGTHLHKDPSRDLANQLFFL